MPAASGRHGCPVHVNSVSTPSVGRDFDLVPGAGGPGSLPGGEDIMAGGILLEE